MKYLSLIQTIIFLISLEFVLSQDCFKWGAKMDNKRTFLQINQRCGITGKTCVKDKPKVTCVFKAIGMLKNDGSVNVEKVGRSLSESVTSEKEREMMGLVHKCASDPLKLKEFPMCFAQGLPNICQNDKIFSKLGNC